MNDALPAWIDSELSAEVPLLAAAGECQNVELKEALPDQVSSLAKEIAGFATSNAGRIFIGIRDDGEICGLGNADQNSRATLISRIEGICANVVKPAITPGIRFAQAHGKIVAVIDVPKGKAPIYYSKDVPYLRQISAARPMAPEEVVDRILSWDKERRGSGKEAAEARFLGQLASLLVDIDVDMRAIPVRLANPWADDLRDYAGYRASSARDLAATAPNHLRDITPELYQMADRLSEIVGYQPGVNISRLPLLGAVETVADKVAEIRARWLPPEMFDETTAENQQSTVRAAERSLADLAKRAAEPGKKMRFSDMQDEAGGLGLNLVRVASLSIGIGSSERIEQLRAIGESLRELETRQHKFDGGSTIMKMQASLASLSERLTQLVTEKAV